VPSLILLAGPNGAGKSTAAASLLRDEIGPITFVNADTVAQGLNSYRPEDVALQAGRIVLQRIRDLSEHGHGLAVETTLAGRGYAKMVRHLKSDGYVFTLLFLWLPSPDLAVARVNSRVLAGGHNIPENVIRRRYTQGLANFFQLYRPLCDTWKFYDSSQLKPMLIATGTGAEVTVLKAPSLWHNLEAQWNP
jgi:predicted ABC-type ATPase